MTHIMHSKNPKFRQSESSPTNTEKKDKNMQNYNTLRTQHSQFIIHR